MWPFKRKEKDNIYKSLLNLSDTEGIEIFKLFYTSEEGIFTHFECESDIEWDSICGIIKQGTDIIKIPLNHPKIIKWLYLHNYRITQLLYENELNFEELQSQYDKLYQDFLNELSI